MVGRSKGKPARWHRQLNRPRKHISLRQERTGLLVSSSVLQCRTGTKAQAVTEQETATDKFSPQTSEATVDVAKNLTKGRKMPILFDAA